jgi:sugar/nucleoside kinase (ribokinase family)
METMSRKKLDVLAVGELNVDLILNNIEGFPVIGKEIIAENMNMTLGSSTAIFAANLSSLGTQVGFLGKIGNDAFGDLVAKSLIDKGIDTSYLILDSKAATGATIVLNYSEDRAMVTYPGAMDTLTLADISDEALMSAKHMHFSSCFLQAGMKNSIMELFSKAKNLGLTTSLDTQWDPSEKWEFDYKAILPYVDIFLPNETELLLIAGEDNIKDALKKLSPHAQTIVVKRGSKGSLLMPSLGDIIEKPAYLNKNVVDAIGAGDSFNSGFIHKFVAGSDLRDCLDFGNMTGALNTTAAGGTGAFISKKHIQESLKEKFNISVTL